MVWSIWSAPWLHASYLGHPIRGHYRLTDVAQCMKRQRGLAVLRPKSGSGHGRRKGLANSVKHGSPVSRPKDVARARAALFFPDSV